MSSFGNSSIPLEKFPSLLAVPLQEALTQKEPALRLQRLCDTMELLVRFLTFIGWMELRKVHGIDHMPAKVIARLAERIEQPTLANWCEMLRAVAAEQPRNKELLI